MTNYDNNGLRKHILMAVSQRISRSRDIFGSLLWHIHI